MKDEIFVPAHSVARPLLRWLSMPLLAAALVGIGVMLFLDVAQHMRFTPVHQHAAAFPLLLVGLSYICLQLSGRRSLPELWKGVALGLAFVLWGTEQLLPPLHMVTIMDELVVTIFVVDLSVMMVDLLRRKEPERPDVSERGCRCCCLN